jgi:hypothetical protein
MANYPRKAQAPYSKINKNSVITEPEKSPVSGWVLVALDAEVRFLIVYGGLCHLSTPTNDLKCHIYIHD